MKIWVNQVINKMISFFFFLVWRNLHLHCIHFVLFMNIVLVLCNSLCNTHSYNSQPQISSFAVVHLVMWCCCFKSHFGLVYTLVSSLYFLSAHLWLSSQPITLLIIIIKITILGLNFWDVCTEHFNVFKTLFCCSNIWIYLI